jgi:hypothetical protein
MATPKTPLEDLNDLPPGWLIALGSAVHELIQRFDAMPRFREMVKGWVAQHEEEEKTLADWQERRRRHFIHAVIRSPRLRNRAEGPPKRYWVFESYSVPNLRATEPDGSTRPVHINGWVSPDLCYRSEPPVRPLLPLKADRALSLVEKYALLAAIHDYACAGQEKINPWHNESPSAISKTPSLPWCLSLDFYRRGRRKLLPAVATKQEPVLRGFLADVEKDLMESGGKAAPGATEDPRKPSKEAVPDVPPAATMSVTDLADRFGLDAEALRKRLERQRHRDKTCFIENAQRTSKEPQFLYYVGKVKPIIDAMRASGKTSGKRPARKKIR